MAKKRSWSTIGGISSERVSADRLAGVLDLHGDQLLGPRLDRVGDAEQGQRALRRRRVAPGLERLGGRLHRRVDVCRPRQGRLAVLLARSPG